MHTASSLGVNIGYSVDKKRASTNMLNDNEVTRSLTILQKNIADDNNQDFGPHNLLVSHASNLCEDLINEEQEVFVDESDLVGKSTKVGRTRKKKSYDKNNVRRSARLGLKKK